jgi:hypothetical protein
VSCTISTLYISLSHTSFGRWGLVEGPRPDGEPNHENEAVGGANEELEDEY